jgi:integrase
MTVTAEQATAAPASSAARRPLARPAQAAWPATRQDRTAVWAHLSGAPFGTDKPGSRHRASHPAGLAMALDWLEDQPGTSWQDRWLANGADAGNGAWRQAPLGWLHACGYRVTWQEDAFFRALRIMVSADLIRPSLTGLITTTFRRGSLAAVMARHRDPGGFSQLTALCSADPDICPAAATRTAHRSALILAAKGGTLTGITTGDVLELLETEAAAHGTSVGATHLFYRVLRTMGVFGDQAPATLRELRTAGQRTPDEMIDRFGITCRPVRDLLVDYLKERQPALDYSSLESLAYYLGGLFWADLERHHPGITSLHLAPEVADGWKQRLRTVTVKTRATDGGIAETTVPRVSYRECLTPVRAFYLDLACWAVEDPARWGPWVVPCPVGSEEIDRRKDKRRRKARMDARTRERLPVLPVLAATVNRRRKQAAELLEAARRARHGQQFTAAGQTLIRIIPGRSAAAKIWAQDPETGSRRDLGKEEEHAFWAFAAVEILRATGLRIEELTELSHYSLVQYRLPGTGELVPLLQIAPSKTDTERLLVISPELAEVLSTIICRLRAPSGAIPLVPAYDQAERVWSAPAPLLFQRRVLFENRAIGPSAIRDMLTEALACTGLTDPADGQPLHFTPHDFRRLFITDAVLSGLPPHIAQVIAGHRDINVTIGYKAIYPQEAIQAHLAFLARRRALRPSEEYRVPTDEEWTEFLGHFEHRKVSTGICGRAFGTPCIHEHACIRCPMLWPEPTQQERLIEIRDNLAARITEAEREGWLGEVEGLKVSLAGAEDKLAQISRRTRSGPVDLGLPAAPMPQPA